jgi:3-dehydroquinate synthase
VRKISIKGKKGNSNIFVGEKIGNMDKYIDVSNTIIVSDKNVIRYYKKRFPDCPVIEIEDGESIKTVATVEHIWKKLLELGADRSTFLLGIGGGIVCDITGFAASTYMRGISFGFVSTTLLSQTDASTGGKNGINLNGYKNMIGAFDQPEFVICDTTMLKTLPKAELYNGFAEVIKHAAIASKSQFIFLEKHRNDILDKNPEALEDMIFNSVSIKAKIVQADEFETGERKKLNFGHTIAHGLQKISNIPHGEAVAIGMVFAADMSRKRGLLYESEFRRLNRLVYNYNLPTSIKCNKEKLIDAVAKDKKQHSGTIDFVMLNSLGKSSIVPLDNAAFAKCINDFDFSNLFGGRL